jgi:Protein of unknown function (DUF2892)
MKMNEGTIDRIVRIVLGVVLLYIGIMVVGGAWGIVLDVIGAVALITGATGFCLLYKLFGDFTTTKK